VSNIKQNRGPHRGCVADFIAIYSIQGLAKNGDLKHVHFVL
jgi:hypothetical protein